MQNGRDGKDSITIYRFWKKALSEDYTNLRLFLDYYQIIQSQQRLNGGRLIPKGLEKHHNFLV